MFNELFLHSANGFYIQQEIYIFSNLKFLFSSMRIYIQQFKICVQQNEIYQTKIICIQQTQFGCDKIYIQSTYMFVFR